MSDADQRRVSLAGRLAARAVTLALDAATSAEDAADHLVRLARSDAAALNRATRQIELRHPDPDGAKARHAIHMLRTASILAATDRISPTDVSDDTTGALA